MNKQDIDIYLNKINNAQSDNERLGITKEFFSLLKKNIGFIDENRNIRMYKNSKTLIDYLVETGAVSTINEIGAAYIPDLSRLLGVIVNRSDAPNKDTENEKISNHVKSLLSNINALPDNLTKDQEIIYDGLIIKNISASIKEDTPLTELTKDSIKKFFAKLSGPVAFRDTLLYEKCILEYMHKREDIRDLIPKLPIETYRDLIDVFDELNYVREFDDTVNEYLAFYTKTGEVDYDELEALLYKLQEKFGEGNLIYSNTYKKFFLNSDTKDTAALLYANRSVMMREVLARIFENDGQNIETTDTEKEYFELFYLPSDIKDDNGEFVYSFEGEFKDLLSFLYNHGGRNWIDVAKYSIRLKNLFSDENKPKEEFLARVYDHINTLDIYELLKENLDPQSLKEPDGGSERFTREMLSLPSSRDRSIERIDAADIALSLMLEADYNKAIAEFSSKQNIDSYKQYNRSIYNSRASRKLIEMYVDRNDVNIESIILKTVDEISSNPNFNIFEEGELSELLQFAYTEKTIFGIDVLNLVKKNLNKNPSYQITEEEARNNVDEFIKKVGINSIGIEQEADFDKFLTSITKLRINSEDGIMPEEVVNFLINQSLRPDSIINVKANKYGKVPERAIEDLGKIDNIRRNGGKKLNEIYTTRDYLRKAEVQGSQNRSSNTVVFKRDNIKQLAKGKLDAINTVFHENTHVVQMYRAGAESKEYTEYLIKKESLISNTSKDGSYYRNNYFLYIEEVEAREVAARMTADYIGNIISQNQVNDIAESLRQSVVENLERKLERQKKDYSHEAAREFNSYRKGFYKIDSDGETRTINEIFDRKIQQGELSHLSFMLIEPMARYEYDFIGRKRTFSEQISMASNTFCNDENELDLIRAIINYSGSSKNANALNTLTAMNDLIATRGKPDSNRSKFIASIVSPNIPDIVENYEKTISEHIKTGQPLTEEMIRTYAVTQSIIQKTKEEPESEWVKGFLEKNRSGKNSLELMTTYCNEMQFYDPKIDKKVSKLEKMDASVGKTGIGGKIKTAISGLKGIFGYTSLFNIKSDIVGRDDARKFEKNLRNREEKNQDEVK